MVALRRATTPAYGVPNTHANIMQIDLAKGEQVGRDSVEFPSPTTGLRPSGSATRRVLDGFGTPSAPITQTGVQPWIGYEMARADIERLSAASSTGAQFLDVPHTIHNETLAGQSYPIDLTTQKNGKDGTTTAGPGTWCRTISSHD
jgi:hypothetical protein